MEDNLLSDMDVLPEDLLQFIKPELHPGELILWASRALPQPTKLMKRTLASSFRSAMFLALSAGIFTVTFGPFSPLLEGLQGLLIVLGVFMAALGIMDVIIPLTSWIERGQSDLQSKPNVYALTDRRAIIWIPQKQSKAIEVHSIPRGVVTSVHRLEYPDGSGDVRFLYRIEGFHYRHSGFEKVADVRWVEDLVRRTLIDTDLLS